MCVWDLSARQKIPRIMFVKSLQKLVLEEEQYYALA